MPQCTTIRLVQDLTPSTDLCTCAAGPGVRLSAVHHMDCAYSRASLKAHIAEQQQLYRDIEEKAANPNARHVALYIRAASISVMEPQGSLQDQEDALLGAVSRRPHDGDTIISIYKEIGPATSTATRPLLRQFLSAIEHRTVDLVLVTSFSRLSRDLSSFLHMLDRMLTGGCDLVSLRDGFDTAANRRGDRSRNGINY